METTQQEYEKALAKWDAHLIEYEKEISYHIDLSKGIEIFDSLYKYYKHHLYHDISHVLHMIEKLEELFSHYTVKNELELYFAAWYHDVYYDPYNNHKRVTNEYLSSCIASMELNSSGLGILPRTVMNIQRFILLTETHNPDDHFLETIDQEIFLDADLSILGETPKKYLKYATNISLECFHLPNFKELRVAFLEKLLNKKSIFYTEYMIDTYLAQAIENIKDEIKRLKIKSIGDPYV